MANHDNLIYHRCKIHNLSMSLGANGKRQCVACNYKLATDVNIEIIESANMPHTREEKRKYYFDRDIKEWKAKIHRKRVAYAKKEALKEFTSGEVYREFTDEFLLENFNPTGIPKSFEEEAKELKAKEAKFRKTIEDPDKYKASGEQILNHAGYKSFMLGANQGMKVLLMTTDELFEYRRIRRQILEDFNSGINLEMVNALPKNDPYRVVINSIIDEQFTEVDKDGMLHMSHKKLGFRLNKKYTKEFSEGREPYIADDSNADDTVEYTDAGASSQPEA